MAFVRINNLEFEVVLEDEKSDKMNGEDGVIYLGLTEYCPAPIIYLRKGMKTGLMRRTIIHELTHAYIFAYGYSLDSEEDFCKFMESKCCDIIEKAEYVYSLLEESPWCLEKKADSVSLMKG